IDATNLFIAFLEKTSITPDVINPLLTEVNSAPIKQSMKMAKVFSRPQLTMDRIIQLPVVANFITTQNIGSDVVEQLAIHLKYSGYIHKEKNNADKLNRLENVKIPDNFDFMSILSLSTEARQKLTKIQPSTIAQASRISGVSPSDISVLLVHLGR
ncbi:MAG TPA: tRNA uridine-5-carboxymethylaminomethyl(34) synthesis enzyme MnmG, partial [Saprospiraceae bacterium]|nr:tRNA uridine-5-carboxymethylaminomethyl(34) synthesis enzyme MnmG [Saprospiraceae bacterium]